MSELDFKSKKNRNLRYLGMAIMVVLIFVTAYVIFRDNGITSILPYLEAANPVFIGLGLFLMLLFIGCEATNIYMILCALGQKVSWVRCFGYGFIGFYFSAITPSATGGQPAQLYYMKKDNINFSYSSIALLIIITFYMFVSLLLSLILFLLDYSFLLPIIKPIWVLLVYGAAVNSLLITGLVFVIFSPHVAKCFCGFCVKLLAKLKIIKNMDAATAAVNAQIEEYQTAAVYIKKSPLLIAKIIMVTTVQLIAVFLIPFCVYKAFGLSGFGAIDVVATQALLTVAVQSLPIPGAVGISEGCFVRVFRVFFANGLLLPAMVLSRGISFYMILLISSMIVLWVHWHTTKHAAYPVAS